MSSGTDESEVLREALIAEAETRAGAHPCLDALASYQEGALEPAAEDEIRDHLVGCRRCAEQLLDLRPLAQPEAPREGVTDLEIESAWRRFESLAATELPTRSPPRSGWAMAVAASVAVLALGLWAGRLQQEKSALRQEMAELSRPVVNLPSFHLGETTRAEAFQQQIVVPPQAAYFVLLLPVLEVSPAAEYAVEFIDHRGDVVLESRGLVMSESGNLQLGLRRGALPAGTYRIVRKASVGDGWQPVQEFRRTISYPGGPESSTRTGGPAPAD